MKVARLEYDSAIRVDNGVRLWTRAHRCCESVSGYRCGDSCRHKRCGADDYAKNRSSGLGGWWVVEWMKAGATEGSGRLPIQAIFEAHEGLRLGRRLLPAVAPLSHTCFLRAPLALDSLSIRA